MRSESAAPPRPIVSVIVVSDYAAGTAEAWEELRATLTGLARQDFTEPFEVLLLESSDLASTMPADIPGMVPRLRVITTGSHIANALKNVGARATAADLVALLDADCVPDPGWLRHLVETFRSRPDVGVVTGRTRYADRGFVTRVMTMITRAYLDVGRPAPTRHVAINNAAYRRQALLDHPLPETTAAHMSLLHAEALGRAGVHIVFEPGMTVEHAYEGWGHEKAIRHSIGYGVIRTRQMDGRIRYSAITRLGYLAVPLFIVLRTLHACWICATRRRTYGVTWYQLPAAFVLAAATCAMEAPGMLQAVRHGPPPETNFR